MQFKLPEVYIPDLKTLIELGFEERSPGQPYAYWQFWLESERMMIEFFPEERKWKIAQIHFYPASEVQLKTILRCLIKPATLIL